MTDDVRFLPFKSDAKDAPAYWLLDVLWIVHVTGEQTGGDTRLLSSTCPRAPGRRPTFIPFRMRRSTCWPAR